MAAMDTRELIRTYMEARQEEPADEHALLEQGVLSVAPHDARNRLPSLPSRGSWVASMLLLSVAAVGLVRVAVHSSDPGVSSNTGSVMLADVSSHSKTAATNTSNHSHSAAGNNSKHTGNASNTTSVPACHTAVPGEVCYDSVLWHKWIGIVENPGGYSGVSRQSNRHDIQLYLHHTKQGNCPRPCEGAYPTPATGNKGSPSIFCFSVARVGTEMDTMFLQHQSGSGIFACDGQAVFSDTDVDLDGFKTTKISSTASGVSVDKTAANSQVFMRTWMTLLDGDYWWKYDFIAKVDPDAVIFPERMRGHLASHIGQDVFFLNCNKYIPETMYGALEVYSKAALGAYQSQHARCEHSLPYWQWGEDRYMANCLEMLDVQTQPEENNFLHDERCWGVDCGNKAAVAFHAFKQVNTWYRCYLQSK